MTLLSEVTVVVYVCWTLLLAASSLTLFYLLFERRQYVQHPKAVLWLVFDSLGLLLMYAERDRVARFLHWLSSTLRAQSACGVFGLAAGVTTEETRQSLAQAFDRQTLLD